MFLRFLAPALLACTPLLPCQLTGSYSINPGLPTGGTNFQTFTDAATALKTQGVSGPVVIRIVPGTHATGDVVWPITAGVSATNTITITSTIPLPGQVKLTGTTNTFTIEGSTASATPASVFYVFDNLEFVSAASYAIFSPEYANDFKVRRCIFGPSHTRHLYIQRRARNCELSNNKLTCPPTSGGSGFYMQQISVSDVVGNTVDCNNAAYGMYFINENNAQNHVHNNWFYGAVRTAALGMGASNYSNHVHNNTFVCTITTATSGAFYTMGTNGRQNRFHDNIVFVVGGGACIKAYPSATIGLFIADGNIYWSPGGSVGIDQTGTPHTSLASWQGATGQDANSRNVSPDLVSGVAPYDLRLRPTSPAIDTARYLPTWVTVDYDGEARGAKADVGSDELVVRPFGTACPGTGNKAPIQGSSGFWKPLTNNFQCLLSNAPPSTVGVLILGLSDKQWGPFPLPLALPGSCTLYTSMDLVFGGATDASGALALPLTLPDLPVVKGLRLFTQYLVNDNASPFSWTLSNALSLDS